MGPPCTSRMINGCHQRWQNDQQIWGETWEYIWSEAGRNMCSGLTLHRKISIFMMHNIHNTTRSYISTYNKSFYCTPTSANDSILSDSFKSVCCPIMCCQLTDTVSLMWGLYLVYWVYIRNWLVIFSAGPDKRISVKIWLEQIKSLSRLVLPVTRQWY